MVESFQVSQLGNSSDTRAKGNVASGLLSFLCCGTSSVSLSAIILYLRRVVALFEFINSRVVQLLRGITLKTSQNSSRVYRLGALSE